MSASGDRLHRTITGGLYVYGDTRWYVRRLSPDMWEVFQRDRAADVVYGTCRTRDDALALIRQEVTS